MPLDFPTSPTDGQVYESYYWDNTEGVWRYNVDLAVTADFSNTATGTYTSGFDYKYISFTADGTLTVTRGGYADVLLVGGGGGAGTGYGGGGGAGGVLYIENAYLPAGSLDVVVGAGGAGSNQQIDERGSGNNGQPSSLGSYVAPGGGAGTGGRRTSSSFTSVPGFNGGSGGGAGGLAPAQGSPQAGGSGFSSLGNNGGTSAITAGAGGGGAGAVGGNATQAYGGNGGNGVANSITGSSVTYGGGGGGFGTTSNGTGGTGGGGDAQGSSNGDAGTANTGGGGGGADGNAYEGGAGGSGIVIVRVRTN